MTEDAGSQVARAAKSQWRRVAKARIGAMSAAERSTADLAICAGLARLADEHRAVRVLAYLSLADEVNMDAFLAAMVECGRPTLLPRVVGNAGLRYGLWRPASRLSRDQMGVLGPESALSDETTTAPSLVVVPGRAFDAAGGRVGRGGGHYDRFLAVRPEQWLVVGVAYECQVVEELPREGHDRDVDCLVTEKCCRRFHREEGR